MLTLIQSKLKPAFLIKHKERKMKPIRTLIPLFVALTLIINGFC